MPAAFSFLCDQQPTPDYLEALFDFSIGQLTAEAEWIAHTLDYMKTEPLTASSARGGNGTLERNGTVIASWAYNPNGDPASGFGPLSSDQAWATSATDYFQSEKASS